MKNIKEAKELVDRYESITLEEIKECGTNPEELTGFGDASTCTLCDGAGFKNNACADCNECFYVVFTNSECNSFVNAKTYNRILEAYTPLQLRNAYRSRAKHIRKIISYEKN